MIDHSKNINKFDIGIVTVLHSEKNAIINSLRTKEKIYQIIDCERYWIANLKSCILDKDLKIVITMLGKSGENRANTATFKLISLFDPSLVLLVGIAAGLEDYVSFADVICSVKAYGYEPVRKEKTGDKDRHVQETPPFPILQDLNQYDFTKCKWLNIFHSIQKKLSISELSYLCKYLEIQNISELKPKIHKKIIASGNKLLANGKSIKELRNKNEEIRASDMEAIGFTSACVQRAKHVPWLIFRGISDFGGQDKDLDKKIGIEGIKQQTAANAAAASAISFLKYGYTAGVDTIDFSNSNKTDNYINEVIKTKKISYREIQADPEISPDISALILDELKKGHKTASQIAILIGCSEKMAENILKRLTEKGLVILRNKEYSILTY